MNYLLSIHFSMGRLRQSMQRKAGVPAAAVLRALSEMPSRTIDTSSKRMLAASKRT